MYNNHTVGYRTLTQTGREKTYNDSEETKAQAIRPNMNTRFLSHFLEQKIKLQDQIWTHMLSFPCLMSYGPFPFWFK